MTFDDATKDATKDGEVSEDEDLGFSAVFAPIEREPKPPKVQEEPRPDVQVEPEVEAKVSEIVEETPASPTSASSAPVEEAERSEKVKTRQAKKFDFRQPKTLERNQLRSLQLLLEAFARPASSILSANLRVHCRLDITGLLQLPWEGVLDMFEDNGSVTVVSLPPIESVISLNFYPLDYKASQPSTDLRWLNFRDRRGSSS